MTPTSLKCVPDAARESAGVPEEWKEYLESYPPDQQTELRFVSRDEVTLAINLLWEPQLIACPHTFTPGGGIIVPKAAVPYFRQGGLHFRELRPAY